jgi:hypothetical protein
MISTVLLLAVTPFSFLGSMDFSAHGKKDSDQSQNNKQNANCEAGEDNNNSCNNFLKEMISDRLKILRQT